MTKTACKLFLAMITAAIVLQSAQAAAPQADVQKMDVSKFKLQSADFKMIKADHWSITGDNLVLKGNVFLPTAAYDIYADQVIINVKNRDFDAIFIAEDGSITITAGMKENFSLADGYKDREVSVLE